MLGELCQPTGAGPEFFHKLMMNASAEMSKGSRRKQSKPNRLLANEGGAPPLNPAIQLPEANPARESPTTMETRMEHQTRDDGEELEVMDLSRRSVDSRSAVASPSSQSHREPSPLVPKSVLAENMETSAVNFPCHTCGEMFPSRSKQEQHVTDYHTRENSSRGRPSPPTGSLFPTAYHQLAGDLVPGLLNHSGLMLPTSKPSDSPPRPAGVPTLGMPGVGGKGSAGTVFQREAYCEICQREFCNKYFLKTHKANIHGIVDPNDPKAVAVMAKVNQAPKVSHPMMSDPVSQKMTSNISSMGGQQKTGEANQSMEDFCEICQKHFCNKYYLKKHKSDVHNLRPDGSKPPTSREATLDNHTLSHAATTSALSHLPMMVPPALNSLSQTSMNNMLFVNPFQNMAAMGMMPPMMQHQFFMPNIGGLGGGLPTSLSPPDLKSEPRSLGSLENGESPPDSDKGDTVNCNICRKEFRNSNYLQIHKAKKHGLHGLPGLPGLPALPSLDDAASTAFLLSMAAAEQQKEMAERTKMSVSPASSDASINKRPVSVLTADRERIQTSPAFNLPPGQPRKIPAVGQSNFSFDATLAAKQADRIMCDICNKDVCNKYFLKAHKLKMHGVVTPGEDRRTTPTKDQMKHEGHLMQSHDAQQQVLSLQPQQQMSPPNTADTSRLIKLGIDPEAYCFLCKKEFCSKYFLRTHKLNMHGVKAERVEGGPQRVTPKGTITPPTSVSPVSSMSPAHPTNNPADAFQWKAKDGTQKSNPLSREGNTTPPGARDRFQWRWKEPANSMRVFCDICDKELCNKYFLRTHKLNIHGISSSPGDTNPDKSNQAMMASSMMADLARVSQANMNNQEYKQPSPTAVSGASSPTELDKQATMRDDVCQICGRVFEDSLAVGAHIKLEHSDENFEIAKETVEEGKLHLCSQCPFKCLNKDELTDHESANHNAEINTCQSCQISFSHVHMLVKHMKEIHNRLISPTQLQKAAKSQMKMRKKIRCNHCSERFSSKELCRAHIRSAHRNKQHFSVKQMRDRAGSEKTNNTKLSSHAKIFSCDRCSYTCTEYRNLRIHQALRHRPRSSDLKRNIKLESSIGSDNTMMQEFNVSSITGADSIAKSTITLPVYNKITEKISVNFTLVPSN